MGGGRLLKRLMMGKENPYQHLSKESRVIIFINLESWLQKNMYRDGVQTPAPRGEGWGIRKIGLGWWRWWREES